MTDRKALRKVPSGSVDLGVGLRSELEEFQSDPVGAIELSAASFMHELHSLLQRAFGARKDISQRELAEILRVSEGRVSQVLSGDENLRASTFARYARALGYEIVVNLRPTASGAPRLSHPTRRRDSIGEVFASWVTDGTSIQPEITVRSADLGPNIRTVASMKYVGDVDVSLFQHAFVRTGAVAVQGKR